ncbi:MAG: tRNA uridine-5-carboxymethylaminomethyl(34) synthesis GTPase MnmE [Verrucomicrobia bacterium]|nr:MAG: tRNA uridine-5-carboxymethylaminomethyl(34) synthesis GTPase MnmE [Verrucomicrobiota bacterium]
MPFGLEAGVNRSIVPGETIAAISTAAGEAAIALVRISGEDAIAVADKIFRGKQRASDLQSHTQHLGEIIEDGVTIDQAMLAVHRAPTSYTGEDLVEISCHGGTLVTTKVLETCLRAGARAARPGEFTERAYLNGKIDLTQAEAVIDLIRAQTDLALRSATEQLRGRLGDEFRALRERLIEIIAHVEASMDFPEEGISPDDVTTIHNRLESLRNEVDKLIATAETGRILREGLRVVIFGATNAGKSSLLNCMLGFDRAIVSEIHGTTRDSIEERINLRGVALRLFDTAGLRPPENLVEREGIERTQRTLETADLRLHIVDASGPRPRDFATNPDEFLILNKSDLAEHADWSSTDAIRISCKTSAGLPNLADEIYRRIGGAKLSAESPVAINARHRDQLRRASNSIARALAAIGAGATPEMFAIDLHDAQHAIDELLGGGDEEAVRDAIFSQFCIGK